jgi:hypothetical protein
MAINYDWNEEVVAQFYANLYIRRETRTFHWLLQGKPLSVSYEHFAQILGFGEEDLARPKLHGGEFPLGSEMAFMYDSVYGKVEFGTTHGMKPVYRMLNQLFRYTLTPKISDNTNISNVAKEILVRMAPGKEDFSIFNFIWEEIIVCSVSANKSCQYAPSIFKMICEVAGVDILPDKIHSWYKPNKGNIERLLKLGKHAPPRPATVGGSSSGVPSSYEPPSSSRGPSAYRGTVPPARKRVFLTFSLKVSLLALMWESTMHRRFVRIGSTLMSSSLSWRRVKRLCSLSTTSSTLPSASPCMDFPPPPNFYNPWEIYGDTSMMYGAPPTDIDDEDFGGGETDDNDDSPPAAHSPHDYDD